MCWWARGQCKVSQSATKVPEVLELSPVSHLSVYFCQEQRERVSAPRARSSRGYVHRQDNLHPGLCPPIRDPLVPLCLPPQKTLGAAPEVVMLPPAATAMSITMSAKVTEGVGRPPGAAEARNRVAESLWVRCLLTLGPNCVFVLRFKDRLLFYSLLQY